MAAPYIVYRNAQVSLWHGDCLDVLAALPDASVDSVVTDPPYGLGFMGKAWDDLPPGVEWARECLRVLKPGGHLLAFGGTRTWHRLAVAVEDAGFEIRDSIAWLYGTGFPKGANLKPAFEPVVVGRKKPAVPKTGRLSIDPCRTPIRGEADIPGRWPTNVTLDSNTADLLDEQHGPVHWQATHNSRKASGWGVSEGAKRRTWDAPITGAIRQSYEPPGLGPSKFFPVFRYQPKAPKRERPVVDGVAHPTVKPLELMRWLVRLATPPGGTVLEPFAGSGTTVEAAVLEGFRCIAIEREAEYLPLTLARIGHAPLGELGDIA